MVCPPPRVLRMAMANVRGQFKFGAQTGWATALAGVMLRDPLVRQATIRTYDALVPMPLHPATVGRTRHNQSLLLAQALRRCTDEEKLDRHPGCLLRHDWLLRIRNTWAQSRHRWHNDCVTLNQAFCCCHNQSSQLHGKRVVLVDDVMTSGASVRAAAGRRCERRACIGFQRGGFCPPKSLNIIFPGPVARS